MRRPIEIAQEVQAMSSVVQLTGAFEGIASMHIARLKDRVARSEAFFAELWQIYTQLRIGKEFHSGKDKEHSEIDKELLIVITSEGSLSGDIDQRLVSALIMDYDPALHDIVVVGHHGATLLSQRGIAYEQEYKLPDNDEDINTDDIVAQVRRYRKATAYYQAYVSLMFQEVRQIELSKAVQEIGAKINADEDDDMISETNYIFEPSVNALVDYMERSMIGVALNDVIIASKLAQQASRFRAMSAAQTRAKDSEMELRLQLGHAKRSLKDERTREIIGGLEKGAISV